MSAPRVFICPMCSKRFNSVSSLNMHLNSMRNRKDHVAAKPQKRQGFFIWLLKKIFFGK
jgi:hypothetical protein